MTPITDGRHWLGTARNEESRYLASLWHSRHHPGFYHYAVILDRETGYPCSRKPIRSDCAVRALSNMLTRHLCPPLSAFAWAETSLAQIPFDIESRRLLMKLKRHPYSAVVPDLAVWERDLLRESLTTNGQQDAITLHTGMVLDGWNRYEILVEEGIEPKFAEFQGTDEDARRLVLARICTRTLSASQRAAVAVDLANLHAGLGRIPKRGENSPLSNKRVSKGKLAEEAGVDEKTIKQAAKVKDRAEPEVFAAVKSGQASAADAASIVDEPPEVQRAAVDAQASGRVKTLKEGTILCERCLRVGAVPDCDRCSAARKSAKEKKNGRHGKPPASPVPQVDGWGIPITEEAVPAFFDCPKFDEILSLLRKIKTLYKELASSPGGAFLRRPGVSMNKSGNWVHPGLETCFTNVKDNKPRYTVCPYAFAPDHVHNEKCNLCHGLGWTVSISKTFAPPEEFINLAKDAHGVAAVANSNQ